MYSLIIVEDERTERDALVRIVPWKDLGFTVEKVFRDGSECLDYLETEIPDVILSDIRMAKKSGLDIAQYVREKKYHTLIVFMSGHKEFEYAQKAIEHGVFYYMLKPVSLPKLREVFGRVHKKLDEQNRVTITKKTNAQSKDGKNAKYGRSVDRVMAYIEEHYNEELSLSAISDKLFLNAGYVSRMLKENTGKNYTEIVAEIRIKRAVWLLENTNMYVYEIAKEVGYQNLKYFYRIFKKVTGKAPNDYREEG